MSVLDGFFSTWSNAKATFGQGTPQTGDQYDGSAKLTQMQSTLDSAAPDSRWTGVAASTYGTANTEHRRVIGEIGGLDQRLAAHVNQSADVVANGRTQLDAVRKWVVDAAASIPPGKDNDRMLLPIANKGISQLMDIVTKTNGELGTIGRRIRGLGDQYTALGDQKFAPKEDTPDIETVKGDEAKDEAEERAEEDVRKALKQGDQEAAARINDVLTRMTPEQHSGAEPLSPEQSAYLSQMQHQMKNMSVADLKAADDRLGDHENIMGDSMQLMANDDIDFPDVDTGQAAPDDRKFENLPQSVQDAIKSPGLFGDQQMKDIAGIVKDGNPVFQTGTELDREMMRKADRMMDAPLWENSSGAEADGKKQQYDVVLQDVFESAGRDHQIVHDHLTGTHGDDGQDFMHDITQHEWDDDGKAAGQLFEWTRNATGPEADIAAPTANVYADYLGNHSKDLLAINGNHQIGDMNPSLVQAFAAGLVPYQDEMVESRPNLDTAFKPLDDLGGTMDKTKGLFAVIDSQPDAAREFNKAAYQNAMDMQHSFAEYAHDHPDMTGYDKRLDDLQSSARMLGVIDGGMKQETMSNIENGHMGRDAALENAKEAYEFKKSILGDVFSYGPGGALVTNAISDTLAGPPPDANLFKFDEAGTVTDIGLTADQQSVQHQITQAQYTVASQFIHQGNQHIDPHFFNADGSLKAPGQISTDEWSDYDAQLSAAMSPYGEINTMLGKFSDTFGHMSGVPK